MNEAAAWLLQRVFFSRMQGEKAWKEVNAVMKGLWITFSRYWLLLLSFKCGAEALGVLSECSVPYVRSKVLVFGAGSWERPVLCLDLSLLCHDHASAPLSLPAEWGTPACSSH